ncbi:MAG TPA: glycosyltransferase [Chloroflexota bacterium]|nr:glycosyltransferase [Chloroflexota bacterium]HUM68632.1 glycosyltransferase [Chloroflexota bacterium]
MKIVQISQSYPPMISGAAIMVQHLAQGLAAGGHEVLVLAASDSGKTYTEETGRLRVRRLASIHNPARAKQRFLFAPLPAMRRAIADFQPDAIHLHEALSLGLCGVHIAREMQLPTILTLHQLPWFPAMYLPAWPGLREGVTAVLWRYGGWFVRQCTAVTVPSVTIAHIVQAHTGIYPTPIYNGLDLHKFNANAAAPDEQEILRQKYGLAAHTPVVLHVGRLDKDKRVDLVLRAFAQVQAEAQLLVVGDGRCRQSLIQLSQQLGIAQRCLFPGYVCADGDLPGLYRLSTVFVTASEVETFALVVHEAMASGLPVVAVTAGCLPEMVEHGLHGYLAPPGDYAGIAAHINWLLQHPGEAAQMGQTCRERAVKYGLEQVVIQFEQLYGDIVMAFQNQAHLVFG